MGKCDPFISVRCCNLTLVTAPASSTSNPVYNSKFTFPVYFPLLNDKIVIRIWDKRSGMSDIYIASIPEIPIESNFFNINSL